MSIDGYCRCQFGRPPRGLLGLHDTTRGYVQSFQKGPDARGCVDRSHAQIIFFVGRRCKCLSIGCQHSRISSLNITSACPSRISMLMSFFQRSTVRSTTSSRAERCLAYPADATRYRWAHRPETSRNSSVCLSIVSHCRRFQD